LLLVGGLVQIPHGDSGKSSAVVEPVGDGGFVVRADSGGELVGGLVLVEPPRCVVPSLCGFASQGSCAEGVNYSDGRVAARLSAANVGVVVKPSGDVGETSFERGSLAAVGVLGLRELAVDALQLILQTFDVGLLVADLVGEFFDGLSGVGDLGFVASAAEWSVVEVEVCLRVFKSFAIAPQLLTGVLELTLSCLVLSGEPVEVVVELGECPCDLCFLVE